MEDMYGVRCRYGLVGGGDGLWWLSTLWILEASYPWPQLRYGWDGWMAVCERKGQLETRSMAVPAKGTSSC